MDLLVQYLTTCRNRLVDLSKRNRLIHFNLDAQRPRYLDVVSASLSQVWEAVSSGSPIPIGFVPEPQEHKDMSMGARIPKPKPAIYAKECDINPCLELAVEVEKDKKLKCLQSLLYFADLDRFVQKLKDDARSAGEEKGISTLHCMLGFLRWAESKDSSRVVSSPLLIAQVEIEIDRRASANQRFLLSGQESDQDGWFVNPSLRIKLQNDYGIELPLLEPGECPASYFGRARSILSMYPEWSISQRVVIGNVAFPRLALYEDLDLQKWESEDGNLLLKHPVLEGLISGVCREPSDQEVREVEEDGIAQPIKGLIFDADSSQLEAIRRILGGETMVLEGPPGTGKSQTIANLIAAYLSRGKSVLFVTEKKAAIEVVERRLEKVGLGEFCLNLHTDSRQSKAALYEKLEKRIELVSPEKHDQIIDRNYQELISTVSTLTRSLDDYYAALEVRPKEEINSFGDLLWSSLHTRDEYDALPAPIRKNNIPEALALSPTTLEVSKGLLENLETAFRALEVSSREFRNHALWELGEKFLDPFEIADLEEHIEDMGEKIVYITKLLELCEGIRDCAKMNLEDCLELEALRPLEDISIQENLYKKLLQCRALQGIANKLRTIEMQFPDMGSSREWFERLQAIVGAIQKKIDYLNSPLAAKFGPCCALAIEPIQAEVFQLNQYRAFLTQIFPTICERESTEWVLCASELVEILPLMDQFEKQLLPFVRNGFTRAKLDWEEVASVADMSRECDLMFDEMKKTFCVELLNNHHQIEQLSEELLAVGWFGRFRSAWRHSFHCLTEKIVPGLNLTRRTLLSRLSQLQNWSQKARALEHNKIRIGLVSGSDVFDTESVFNLLRAHESEVRLASKADWLYPVLVESGKTFVDIHLLSKRCFGDSAVAILSQIHLSYQNAPTCRLEDSIQQARAAFEETKSLAQCLKDYGLDDCENSERLYSLTMSLDALLQSEELRALLSDVWPVRDIIRGCEIVNELLSTSPSSNIRNMLSSVCLGDLVHIKDIVETARNLATLHSDLQNTGCFAPDGLVNKDALQIPLINWASWQSRVAAELPKLTNWLKFRQALRQLEEQSAPAYAFVHQLLMNEIPLESLSKLFAVIVAQSKAKEAIRYSNAHLNGLATSIRRVQQDFRTFDRKVIDQGRNWTRRVLLSRAVHQGSCNGRRSERTGLQLIRHELGKQKRRISSRRLLNRALQTVLDLTPCFMMSPLQAAECLQTQRTSIFDLVIIDEASQLRPEEALSAIVRGSQLVVVGDSKQLPPTTFFGDFCEEEEVEDDEAIDNESILDMAKATFPSHSLRWHYRSKHDSLINFSNQQFYDGRLIVCPSSNIESEYVGVHLIQANGIYGNGENPEEAAIVVNKAVTCMKDVPDNSIGIVAMNREQQELLQSLLYEARCKDDEVNSYLERWEGKNEHCFVKNLENVQGDERDIILISTVYGPSERGGKVLRRFGPINSIHGHRRLNVLCTRARTCTFVVSSLQPSDVLPPTDTVTSKGIDAFAKFLEYAGSGQRLAKVSSEGPESPFEEYVGKFLADAGYNVYYQIGQLGFRIDIGIRHPVCPYGFIAGIECDGAAYHSHKSARDRDRLRQEILENHGWKIFRLWSTDWFYQPKEEQARLLDWLSSRIDEIRRHEHAYALVTQQGFFCDGEVLQAPSSSTVNASNLS